MWAIISSVAVYGAGALVAFLILRKHKFGKFYSLTILVSGFFIPLTLGIISSAAIAFVYKTSNFLPMDPNHALIWGWGLTLSHALFGYLRILATL